MSKSLAIFAILLATLRAATASAAPTVLSACGETVTDAVLAADLDCSEATGFAVTIADGGVLDLAGHRLTGTPSYGTDHAPYWDYAFDGGVHCLGACTITGGGGAIVSPAGLPPETWYSTGVYGNQDLKGNKITISDTELSGWTGFAVMGHDVVITNCVVTESKWGVVAGNLLTMDGCTVTNNSEGAHLWKGAIRNSAFSGNKWGVYVLKKLELTNSSITASENLGHDSGRLTMVNSTISGNCTTPVFGPCADIRSRKRPRLIDSSCGSSVQAKYNSPLTWKICDQD